MTFDDEVARIGHRRAVRFFLGRIIVILLVLAFLKALVFLLSAPAIGHWKYPSDCCSDRDCFPLSAEQSEGIRERHDRFVLWDYREVMKSKARPSPDGKFHLCEGPRRDIICFLAPGGSM